MCLKPEYARGGGLIDAGRVPPSGFITAAMDLAVVSPAERYRKFITDLAAECPAIVQSTNGGHPRGVGRRPYNGWLGHRLDVVPVAKPTRGWQSQ